MASQLVDSQEVLGSNGDKVRVLFYQDRSIRFRIYKAPVWIEEAFLTGNRGQHAIIKVVPQR